jgi:hypothetical protein
MTKTARAVRADLVSDALRQLWAKAESDPVPDDFLTLLDQLDEARTAGRGPAAGPLSGPLSAPAAGDDEAA